MLGPDELAEVEGDAEYFLTSLGVDLADPPSIVEVCRRAGAVVTFDRMGVEGSCLGDDIRLRRGMSPARQRFVLGHELAHREYRRLGQRPPDLEARCDAFAAAVVAPRPAFRRAMGVLGHRVHELAEAFGITQSVALLRVGEVSGRPVTLLRWPEPIIRGDAFAWPSTSALVRMLRAKPDGIHPLRITDEPGKWGLMAESFLGLAGVG